MRAGTLFRQRSWQSITRRERKAGLIITEATGISREGLGWPYAPGIWSDEQVEAWKPITKAVHDRGGRIVCQLWHMGRMVHSSVTGLQPVAPSPTTAPGQSHTYDGKQPYEEARALRLDEIPRILAEYERASQNAIKVALMAFSFTPPMAI